MKAKKESGQSLVELAFLLPAFCFSVLAIIQLIVFCRNQLEMQRMAQVKANAVASTTSARPAFYSQFNRLWGRIALVQATPASTDYFATWQYNKGISTVHDFPARLFKIKVSASLLPGLGLTERLGLREQHATAFAVQPPPLPKGQD